jgi:DNA-binding transcriptional MerR regulator
MSETISFERLSSEVNVPRHIIHLWTKKFPILSPQRLQDGKVGFKNRDLALARGLKHLLINDGKSITEVQALLNERGIGHVIDIGKNSYIHTDSSPIMSPNKPEGTVKLNHKHIAKQAFSNLSHIFSKDKQKSILEKPALEKATLPTPVTPDINTVIPDIPETTNHSVTTDDTVPENFEDNWRHLMEKTGKATPIDEVRDKSNLVDEHLLSDIWEIDDEIDLFDDEPMIHTPAIMPISIQKPRHKNLEENHLASRAPSPIVPPLTPAVSYTKGLTIEQSEKIKHLVAKLDIMRDEMTSANHVITKALKAFGYSGFENAYNTFDQKAVY